MNTPKKPHLREVRDLPRLIRVALGKAPADLAVVDARLVNVYTGEIVDNQTICVSDQWIASVGPRADASIGPQTTVIEAAGRTLIPGLIDGHAHLSWLYSIDQFLRFALAGGTTTIITESMEVFPVAGVEGVVDFLNSLENQPIKLLATAPFMASISHAAMGIAPEILERILAFPNVVGLGESYWQSVLQHPDRAVASMQAAHRAGKTVEGHSAGAKGKKLMAYTAAGVTSCHEPITPDEALERLRLGLHVMIREGSIRRDLAAISKIKDTGIDLRRVVLVTDGMTPADLMEKGYLEYVVQKAIDCGFDPVNAIQMATLNVAEHFCLDDIIGGIAPGRYADMLLIPDEVTIRADMVISNGRVIAENGRPTATPRAHAFKHSSLHTVHLPQPVTAEDFALHAPPGSDRVSVRIIEMVTDLVTRELRQDLPVTDGRIQTDRDHDLINVAAIDRRFVPGKRFCGLIKGFGLKSGAVASSAAWDTSDIIVVGADAYDMAMAVNRIHDLQGGTVVCEQGRIVCELAMPVFGIITTEPMETAARALKEINRHLARLGVSFPDPVLTLVTLTGAAIPYLRICEEGLVNLREGATVGLLVE